MEHGDLSSNCGTHNVEFRIAPRTRVSIC